MNNKLTLIIFACFTLFVIAVRAAMASWFPGNEFADVRHMFFTGLVCVGAVAAGFGTIGWQLSQSVRVRRAKERKKMGMETAVPTTTTPPQPKPSRPKKSPFPPGSIGDVSSRIGYDVRDLLIAGFDHSDIADLETGRITLDELFKRGPRKT